MTTERCDDLKLAKFIRKCELIRVMNQLIKDYAYRYPNYDKFFKEASLSHKDYVLLSDILQDDSKSDSDKTDAILQHSGSAANAKDMLGWLVESADLPFSAGNKYGLYGITLINELTGDINKQIPLIKLYFELHGTKRTRFCREAERIVTTRAFRHIQYKTQVMINSASDDQRTRLLHSLEVQGISRTLAMQLGANWELAQAIALGHDVGHVPFGHAGEAELDKCLRKNLCGRFTHSLQSVKVLNELETHPIMQNYGLSGIGLSRRVLEGILKHDADLFMQKISKSAFKLQCDCRDLITKSEEEKDFVMLGGIESQIVYWADKIAYLGHDWDEFANSDLLEAMLNRLNIILDQMVTISNNNDANGDEKDFIVRIVDLVGEMNKSYQNDKGESELPAHLQEIKELEKAIPEQLLYFTEDDYCLVFRFFSTASSWMTITKKTPRKYKDSNDILYIIFNYFRDTKTRRIVPKMQDHLLRKTNENTDSLREKLGNEKAFIGITNERWDIARNEADKKKLSLAETEEYKRMNKKEKDKQEKLIFQREFRSSLIVSVEEDILDAMTCIDEFIFHYYINSTLVKNMTMKAGMIIRTLFKFFMQHPDMLPLEYQRQWRVQSRKLADEILNKYCATVLRDHKSEEISEWENLRERVITHMPDKSDDYYIMSARNNFTDLESFRRYVSLARTVADFIGDMTDRMAVKKYNEIISSETKWSTDYSE